MPPWARRTGPEERLPSGILLSTVGKVAGYARKSRVWPATFGLICCVIELLQPGGPGATWPGSASGDICHPRAKPT
jgi:NADH:ubiquinone oxidoreductase subunit B-like Fe-S oxidoreductase